MEERQGRMTVRIGAVGDGGQGYVSAYYLKDNSRFDGNTEISGRQYAHRNSHEPIIEALADHIEEAFNIKSRYSNRGSEGWLKQLTICRQDRTPLLPLLLTKRGGHYYLNGLRANRRTLSVAVARVFYHSAFIWDGVKLNKMLLENILLPENITYVLENRTPYHFIDPEDNRKVRCRLNVKRTGEEEFALELSDGVWGTLKTNELNTFVEFYWKGGRRGNWKLLSPRKLYMRTVGREPTDVEIKTMISFLKQNRTQDIVERRARQLMEQMEQRYPDRIKIVKSETSTVMYVRGKRADWRLTGRQDKLGETGSTQAVSTEHLVSIDVEGVPNWRSHCIDNVASNSSIGDQFCTRALATMNDDVLSSMVSTVNLQDYEDYQKELRFENVCFDDMKNLFEEYCWSEEYETKMSRMREDGGGDS